MRNLPEKLEDDIYTTEFSDIGGDEEIQMEDSIVYPKKKIAALNMRQAWPELSQ